MATEGESQAAEPLTQDSLDPREQGALEILQEICAASRLAARPEPRGRHAPYLDVELVGEDVGSTLGRYGHTLDALQYLANLVIGRRIGPDVRVILDAEGYRARRSQTLTDLAREFAEQVRTRQEECEFEPLPAHERRIIHNALNGEEGIRTYSEGDDPDRRVIIAPR